jgi:hypothetical protein
MLNNTELKKLRLALPDNAYQQIAEEVGLHKDTVGRVLTNKNRYRKDVIDAALIIAEKFKSQVQEQKQKVKELKAV